jgi:hypothetical protein
MTSALKGHRVVVISDNDLLFEAIKRNLGGRLQMEVLRAAAVTPEQTGDRLQKDRWSLIVVAQSAPVGEPVVELVRASLAHWLGRVPLLIISERPFDSRPKDGIVHLDFPFEPDQLYRTVVELFATQEDTTR